MADEAFLGRRLLYLRSRLKDEQRNGAEKKLRRKLIKVLLQLNSREDAAEEAGILVRKWPEWPAARSIAADIQCRRGNWAEARVLFGEARDLFISIGDLEGAGRLETGPLYRLAEAGEDTESCISLSRGESPLKRVLAARAFRRSGREVPVIEAVNNNTLASGLKVLEDGWAGSIPPEDLLRTALDWGDSEPEWRWRLIVEGIQIWQRLGLSTEHWKGPLKATSCPVLDPRWSKEWRKLNDDGQEGP